MVLVVNNIKAGCVIYWMVDFSVAVNMLKLFKKGKPPTVHKTVLTRKTTTLVVC